MRIRRWIALMGCALATVGAQSATVLPEVYQHLEFARKCLDQGNVDATVASSDLILLPHIKVYVDDRAAPSRAVEALRDAQTAWERALGQEVHFVSVPSPGQADVTIHYASTMRREGRDVGGFATWKRSVRKATWGYDSRLTADIELRLDQPNGQPMTRPQLHHAAMHELGHILGLDDSAQVGEIMGPLLLSRPAERLANGEIQALCEVRAQAQSVRMSALFSTNTRLSLP